jgi:thymidine kinase
MFSNIIEMSETISVFLTTAQKNKMASGKTFQLSASQLQAGSGKHAVDIEMSTKNYKILVKNVGKNKGYRFTSDKVINGSGLFKDIEKQSPKSSTSCS